MSDHANLELCHFDSPTQHIGVAAVVAAHCYDLELWATKSPVVGILSFNTLVVYVACPKSLQMQCKMILGIYSLACPML